MIARRSLVGGLLAVLAAPAVIRTPGLLMPVKVLMPTTAKQALREWVLAQMRRDAEVAFPDAYQFTIRQGQVFHMSDAAMDMRGMARAVAGFDNRNPFLAHMVDGPV